MAFDVVLFDLGGVLIELSGLPQWTAWTGADEAPEQTWARWLHSPAVRAFESGRAKPREFAERIVAEFDLPLAADEFLSAFAAWPRGLFPGACELVADVRARHRVACFSNTNALHWPRFLDELGLRGQFDAHFASHELGALKPDVEAFERVATDLGCAPGAILFLDDNALNVQGARRAGLQAERVAGPEGARSCLRRRGLLP